MGADPRSAAGSLRLVGRRRRDAVTSLVRQMIADGTLKPGGAAPSGRALARETGLQPATCRRALRELVEDGTLTRGVSATARLRVAQHGRAARPDKETLRWRLSGTLGALRRAAGMNQPDLAAQLGVSSTTLGHAETGRLWQAREFWQRADALLGNGLLDLYDAYQAAGHSAAREEPASVLPVLPASVTITPDGVLVLWPDGTETLVRPHGRQDPEDFGAGPYPPASSRSCTDQGRTP